MTDPGAHPRDVVVTICSPERHDHVVNQHRILDPEHSGWGHRVVRLGAPSWEPWPGCRAVDVPVDGPLPLATARNAGLDAAVASGARTIVALDGDCVATPAALARYREVLATHPGAVACGPVTYLPEGAPVEPSELARATDPHPVRPAPPDDEVVRGTPEQYSLFWSLSFALDAGTWRELRARGSGFAEEYRGYGAEDTDFGRRLAAAGTPMVWAGGAHAYHQHHPVSSPPVEHLDDILRNGALFARRWGWWPMHGWLHEFHRMGLIEPHPVLGWRRLR